MNEADMIEKMKGIAELQQQGTLYYWITLVVAILGGGTGIRKIMILVKEATSALAMLPDMQKSVEALTLQIKEIKDMQIMNALSVNEVNIQKVDNRIDAIESVLMAWFSSHDKGLFIANQNGDWNWVNNEMMKLTGTSQDDLLSGSWLMSVHQEDREEVIRRWKDFVSGSIRRFEKKFRVVKQNNDGTSLDVLCRAAKSSNVTTKVVMIVGSIREVKNHD